MNTTRLPVRRRRTIDERGGSRVELFVECPSHDTPRATNACLACGFGDEPRTDEATGEVIVDCCVDVPHAPAHSVLSRCDAEVVLVAGGAPLAAAAKVLLKAGGANSVAIAVGDDGAPIGVLRRSRCLPTRDGARAVVRDVVEPVPLLLSARDSVERASFEVARARVDLAVVVGWGGGVLGVVRATELVREQGQAYAR